MPRLRALVAIWGAKATSTFLHLTHAQNSDIPGRVATRLCPTLLADMNKPKLVICVTGTNGKTTVSNVIAKALRDEGYTLANNSIGYNARPGVALALIDETTLLGRTHVDAAVLETDELSARELLPGLNPDFIVCTNLTRDSIKRNGNADYIAYVLTAGIPSSSTLILNADDLICARIGSDDNRRVFFGIAQQPTDTMTPFGAARDLTVCPLCQTTLDWDYWRYNHIGHAHCPNCGFSSPDADYLVREWDEQAHTITMDIRGESFTCSLLNGDIANVYNQATIVALLHEQGMPLDHIAEHFRHAVIPEKRLTVKKVGDVTVVRTITKGLVGVACSRSFDLIRSMVGRKSIVLNIDEVTDAENDCENTCWIYDADSEFLAHADVRHVTVGGVRRYDQALRLAIAGIDPAIMETTESERAGGDVIPLDDIDFVYNLHSVHNAGMTGDYVQRRLVERLEERVQEGSTDQGESHEN